MHGVASTMGNGSVEKIRCKSYNGRKIVSEKTLEVHIDKCMKGGQKVTFLGEGHQEPGLEPGDIIIVLDQKDHAVLMHKKKAFSCVGTYSWLKHSVDFKS